MAKLAVVLVLSALVSSAHTFPIASAAASKLRKSLTRGRALVVEVTQQRDSEAWKLDVTELSARLRDAGATALLVPPHLIEAVLEEQATAKGNFPEPLPVLCTIDASDATTSGSTDALSAMSSGRAAGVAVRHAGEPTVGLAYVARMTEDAGLPLVVIALDEFAHAAAVAAGAAAVVCDYQIESCASASAVGASAVGTADGSTAVSASTEGSALAAGAAPVLLGAWGGDEDEMYVLLLIATDGL